MLEQHVKSMIAPSGIAAPMALAMPLAVSEASNSFGHLRSIIIGLLIAMAFVPVAMAVNATLELRHVHIIFLIPVVVAATRYGLLSALAAAVFGTASSAYLFYPPLYSFHVLRPTDVVALTIFIAVAAITSHLSAVARSNAAAASRNARQLELLYAFSRRLAAANAPEEIYAAIQEHASAIVGGKVSVLLDDEASAPDRNARSTVPAAVREAIQRQTSSAGSIPPGSAADRTASSLVSDDRGTAHWLLRPFSRNLYMTGFLLVDLGAVAGSELAAVRVRVDGLLDDAMATLERLDLAATVDDAELRRQTQSLREAVIGSVSHGLRTPLASIMGSASILAASPAIARDQRLASLSGIIVKEAERLNGDIQKMLDAAAISTSGPRPALGWIEPSDLVNAAVEVKSVELAAHRIELDCAADLPLVRVDPAHVREALGLILDNAARYSPAGTIVRITARRDGGGVAILVQDEGVGFDEAERARLLEKFYRGARVRDTTRGSGLGLWIANAFVSASNGRMSIKARSDAPGAEVTLHLPAATDAEMEELGATDD